jgi:hypothetical protein
MIWLLLVVFFTADGVKVQVKTEPTLQGCQTDVAEIKGSLNGPMPEGIYGVGLKCDGPIPDPTIRMNDANK